MHPVLALVCMAASAVLYGVPFPPLAWRAVAWVALVPFLLAVRSSSRRIVVVVAAGFAAWGAFSTAGALPASVSEFYGQPIAVGYLFLAVLATITTSSVMIVFAFCYRRISTLDVRFRPLLAAAAWVAYELVRARVLGNPWAAFGYSQVAVTPLVQIADVTGVYGIGFALVAVNAAIVEILVAPEAAARRRAAAGGGIVAVCVGLLLLYGQARFSGFTVDPKAAATRVVVVQGNIYLGTQWREEFYGENLGVYLSLTAKELQEKKPSLVVWPENAMTFFVDREPLYRDAIGRVLSLAGAELVAGGPRVSADDSAQRFNSAFLMATDGSILAHYDKQELLPFAETLPVRHLDPARRDFGGVREFTPGADMPPLPTVAGAAGIVICNESLYAQTVTRRIDAGAELLINLANDGWLGDPRLSGIAFDMTTLRAIEQRRYIVRASTSGPSAVIDPLGRVWGRTKDLSRDTTTGEVRPVTVRTFYARFGDLFAVLCVIVTIGAVLRSWKARR